MSAAAQDLATTLGLGDIDQLSKAVCNYDSRGWFSILCFQNVSSFQLDIVGFLAILGEGSVLATAQVATLSKITLLPRLLPAPQALMRPFRPVVLNSAKGWATGVDSGNHRDSINHIGNVLLDAEALPAYAVRCVEIVRKDPYGEVKARMLGPLWMVAILGCIMSAALFGISIWQEDGFAILATLALSFLSTLVGLGNKWKLNLPTRKNKDTVTPPGNVVIRYPKGSFLVIQCTEDVARELYFAPEAIDYEIGHSWKYQMVALFGTFLLMVGVVALGNATTWVQIGFASSYVILNAAYWVVGALPAKTHWDLSCFEVKDQRFDGPLPEALPHKLAKHYVDCNETFTLALWKVIVATKSTEWIGRSNAAPQTEAWKLWLHEAETRAREAKSHYEIYGDQSIKVWDVPDWDAQSELGQYIKDGINAKAAETA